MNRWLPMTFQGASIPKWLSDLSVTVGGFVGSLALGLVSGVVAARVLGPAGRGELAAIQIVPGFLVILAACGSPQSIVYFTAKDPERTGEILGTSLAGALALAVPICILGYFVQVEVLQGYPEAVRWAGILFLAYIPLNLMNGLPWSTFLANKEFKTWSWLRIQPQLVYCLGIVAAGAFGARQSYWITDFYLLGIAAFCIPWTWVSYRRLSVPLTATWKTLSKMLPYGGLSMLNYFPNALNQRLDQAVIAVVLPKSELGFYAVAVSWAALMNPVFSGISANLFPRVASRAELSAADLFSFTVRWGILLAIALAILLAAATPVAFPILFGVPFSPAIRPALVLVAAGAFGALNLVFSDGFRGIGRPEVPLAAEFAGLVVTGVGLALFLNRWGVLGAAWVSLLSYSMTTAVYWVRFPRPSENRGGWLSAFYDDWNAMRQLVSSASPFLTGPGCPGGDGCARSNEEIRADGAA